MGMDVGLIFERTPQYTGMSNQALQPAAGPLRQSLKDKLRIMKRKTLAAASGGTFVFPLLIAATPRTADLFAV